jgi:SAM-dependent methyltransferase
MITEQVEVDENLLSNFDYVLALNVWEYIYAPVVAHRNIYDLLKPGGMLIANYPFVYCQHNPTAMDFLRYTPAGVEKILSKIGFQIIEHKLIKGNQLLNTFYNEDRQKMASGVDHLTIGSFIKARKA